MRGPTKKLGPIGSAVFTFIGHKEIDKQSDKAKLSTINIKTPPLNLCNVVFNLNAPLGDKNPNQTISARFSSLFSNNGVKTFINCEPFQS